MSLNIFFAIPSANVGPIVADKEYFAFRIAVNHSRTVGTPSCAGCGAGANIEIVRLDLDTTSGPQPAVRLEGSADGRHLATWQTAAVCASVPLRNLTWGAIKSLYR